MHEFHSQDKILCLPHISDNFVGMDGKFCSSDVESKKLAPQRRSQRHMGGQVQPPQQGSAAAASTSFYDNEADAGDAVMARWLQSAGLQHLASPLSSSSMDHRLAPNMLMQGYGAQSAEEKQRLYKLMRNLNFNVDSGMDILSQQGQSLSAISASDGFYSPEFRGDFGAGLLDLHAMDDTELLTENVMNEPFEASPYILGISKGYDNDLDVGSFRQQKDQFDSEPSSSVNLSDKEGGKDNVVAKIKVVVRKRPLNKKELSRKEDDIVSVGENSLTLHEPKLKVDLTAYVEKHEFCFDAVLDEHVTNDEVYRVTVEPIIPTIFQRTKATCFAYGQTGSGKTFTMQPLPLRASQDLVRLLHQPVYRSQKFKLWLSYFEIYGGKLFDLLSDRKKLCMREDGRQQVCIVGLQEFEVSDVQIVKEYIEKGNAARSTGSTGANEESSRSHAILQLAVKKQPEVKESRRNTDVSEPKSGKLIGKISFIDLAGSERGADTTDNDRQTRIEGAEINKSLLALKECIRALDNDQIHIPFRGSKLTEVLRDSFVGNSRTVMISCISPNAGSCEHTLNTLRYADRVKSLSKSGNVKKDPTLNSFPVSSRDTGYPLPIGADTDEINERHDIKQADVSRRVVEREPLSYNPANDYDKLPSSSNTMNALSGREDAEFCSDSMDRSRIDNVPPSYTGNTHHKLHASQYQKFAETEERVQKVSPPRRTGSSREDKSEKLGGYFKKDVSKKQELDPPFDGNINAILEEALISAHRKEIEDTMDIVREEMKLLAEVDQPGSLIDNYVSRLSFVLSRKSAGLVSLQARLAKFQNRLKEQEILTRKKISR